MIYLETWLVHPFWILLHERSHLSWVLFPLFSSQFHYKITIKPLNLIKTTLIPFIFTYIGLVLVSDPWSLSALAAYSLLSLSFPCILSFWDYLKKLSIMSLSWSLSLSCHFQVLMPSLNSIHDTLLSLLVFHSSKSVSIWSSESAGTLPMMQSSEARRRINRRNSSFYRPFLSLSYSRKSFLT